MMELNMVSARVEDRLLTIKSAKLFCVAQSE